MSLSATYLNTINQIYKSHNKHVPYPTMHHLRPKCVHSILNGALWDIFVLNGTLWDMEQMHCGIYKIDLLDSFEDYIKGNGIRNV